MCALALYVFLFTPPLTYAADDLILQIPVPKYKEPATYTNTIKLCETEDGGALVCNGMVNYFAGLYTWLVVAVAIIAVVALMIGGLQWMTSRGNSGQAQKALKIISNAIIGLVLTLGSYSILYLINPKLTSWPSLHLNTVAGMKLIVSQIQTDNEVAEAGSLASASFSGASASSAEVVSYDTSKVISDDGDKLLRQATADKLKLAGQNCSSPIHVISSWRSYDKQLSLYNAYLSDPAHYNLACDPGSDPTKVHCPHTSGQAVDLAHTTKSGGCNPVWTDCMKQAGFCQLSSECWHFEYPTVSTSACH